jgi:hypothetical protein
MTVIVVIHDNVTAESSKVHEKKIDESLCPPHLCGCGRLCLLLST